ncbi:MAG: response regulator [Elusimicrobia bacterium]|nr:response regulator [Elusimicrobiota bacterium]
MSQLIWIVEDEVALAGLVKAVVEAEGFSGEILTSGEEVLKRLAERRPALILLDIMMPGLNGFQVLERLKANTDTQAIPVVVVSTLVGREYVERAKRLGALDFFTKPFEPEQLVQAVKRILVATP